MTRLERSQSLVVVAAVAGGVILGQVDGAPAVAERLILPALLVMLFAAFLGVPLDSVRAAFGNRRVLGTSLLVNFVWNPIFAVLLGFLFLRPHPALRVGLLMLLVTPCTDWYLVFTDVAEGDVPLATSLLPYNLVLQLLLLPVYLYAFAGELVALPLDALVKSVALVLVAPLVLAAVGRRVLPALLGPGTFEQRVLPALGPVQVVFLGVAVGAMFASQGALVRENPGVLLLMAVPVVAFYAVNLALGLAVGRLGEFSYEETACLECTILSRNSPTALAIAVAAFPHEPLIPLALVIGPLLELPLLSGVTQFLLWLRDRDSPVIGAVRSGGAD